MNYYLSGILLLLIIYIIFLIYKKSGYWREYQEIKKQKQSLEVQRDGELEVIKNLQSAYNELQVQIGEANIKYRQAVDRANDATAATDRLIKSEEGRAKAELERYKALEDARITNELEKKKSYCDYEYSLQRESMAEYFHTVAHDYQEIIAEIKQDLGEYQKKREAINQAILREREIEEREEFYRIQIKENDIKDIEVLRAIETQLINREVLNKLIFEVFIKRPLNEMTKRVLQGKKIGGIYKITYIKTGESYIGRSVDIANRWKEHCLSSLNIGTIAHSTFHNILAEKGLQNFTWEVLEEVPKEKQSEREKYWIDFYHTNTQFNSKAGG